MKVPVADTSLGDFLFLQIDGYSVRYVLLIGLLIIGSLLAIDGLWAALHPTVEISWDAVGEVDIIGYNILRSTNPDGPFQPINSQLIPVQGDGFTGNDYSYVDYPEKGFSAYYYLIERLDKNANATLGELIVVPVRSQPGRSVWVGLAIILVALFSLWKSRKFTKFGHKP